MSRDIKKAIDAYNKRYAGLKTNEGAFYASDILQLLEISAEPDLRNYHYKLAGNALEAGFIIGYRKAEADMKKRKKEA